MLMFQQIQIGILMSLERSVEVVKVEASPLVREYKAGVSLYGASCTQVLGNLNTLGMLMRLKDVCAEQRNHNIDYSWNCIQITISIHICSQKLISLSVQFR
jgi:hypothetical protein